MGLGRGFPIVHLRAEDESLMSSLAFPSPAIEAVEVLGQIVRLMGRSLASYLIHARPIDAAAHPEGMQVWSDIARDQEELIERIAAEMMHRDAPVDRGQFPMHYTSLNDLSFRYLHQRMVESQKRLIIGLETAVEWLRNDIRARALAEEALGTAKAHLDSLLEFSVDKDSRGPTSMGKS